jgi:cobalt-zinc-cadmium efflux system outer membrane protein
MPDCARALSQGTLSFMRETFRTRSARAAGPLALALVLQPTLAMAQNAATERPDAAVQSGQMRVSLDDALREAHRAAPDLVVARARESVARAEVGIAGVYPNPSLIGATSTQYALVSGGVSIPLVVLGQRGAAIEAAEAEEVTVASDTRVSWNDVRQATVLAYVALWQNEGFANARSEAAALEAALESLVVERVEVGSAPELDAIRVHAERLRADADAVEATARIAAAGSRLGGWMGMRDGAGLRASAGAFVPDALPPLPTLLARLDTSAPVQREGSDVRASQARIAREKALVRPFMVLDVGFDALDRTVQHVPGTEPFVNYRAQLAIDVPLFNQRGPYVEREQARGEVARARMQAVRTQAAAELAAAYRTFEAASARERTLSEGVVPAAREAANATKDAYVVGRAQLVAVLDAQRVLIEARVAVLDAQAARANAWADVEHALGAP